MSQNCQVVGGMIGAIPPSAIGKDDVHAPESYTNQDAVNSSFVTAGAQAIISEGSRRWHACGCPEPTPEFEFDQRIAW